MKPLPWTTALLSILVSVLPLQAYYSGLSGLSEGFRADYDAASKLSQSSKSTEPFLLLLPKYLEGNERAELEMTLGMLYNQRTGLVDPAEAVEHFTAAMRYDLPEKTCSRILLLRGNSQEQLKKRPEALNDYLRGLIECSYHDFSGGWPEIKEPPAPMSMNSPDPENALRVADYSRYRRDIDYQRFLLQQRYFLVEAVRRVTRDSPLSSEQVLELLKKLSPDSTRFEIILSWLNSENKRPWP